ncbi:MAG: right-handed parallel beta-helix repeat-containing protein [Treponema sp.]|nr:right-handed parallel beta-helix repeat-containing protein [Treponema sp.]
MQFLKKLCSFTIIAFILVMVSAGTTACELLQADVPAFIYEYTSESAFFRHDMDGVFPSDASSVMSVPADREHKIVYVLRNPGHHPMDASVFLDGYNSLDPANPRTGSAHEYYINNPSSVRCYQNPDDHSLITLELSKDFLLYFERGGDINPQVHLFNRINGVQLDYNLKLRSNSVPPGPQDGVVLLGDDSFNTDYKGTYVLCFNLPGTDKLNSTIHDDVAKLYINNEVYDVALSSGVISLTGSDAQSSAKIVSNPKTNLNLTVNKAGGGFDFSDAVRTKNQSFGYKTLIEPDGKNHIFKIRLEDRRGLAAESVVSVDTKKIETPVVYTDSGAATEIPADVLTPYSLGQDNRGYATVFLKLPSRAFTVDEGGQKNYSAVSDVQLCYELYAGTKSGGTWNYSITPDSTGTFSKSTNLDIPPDRAYQLKVYCKKNMFVDSDPYVVYIKPQNTKVFAGGSGSDVTGKGTLDSPVATVTKALTMLDDPGNYGAGNVIFVTGDIQDNVSVTSASYVTVKGYDPSGKSIRRKIDGTSGSAFTVNADDTKIDLENLVLCSQPSADVVNVAKGYFSATGCVFQDGNTGLNFEGNSQYTPVISGCDFSNLNRGAVFSNPGSAVIITGSTFKHMNLSTDSAVRFENCSQVILNDVHVTDNAGCGIKIKPLTANRTSVILNSIEVTRNTDCGIVYEPVSLPSDYTETTLLLTGKVTITGNTKIAGGNTVPANLMLSAYDNAGVTQLNKISVGQLNPQSRIGFTSPVYPDAADPTPVAITQEFSYESTGLNARQIFISDESSLYAVGKNLAGGEAVIVCSSLTVEPEMPFVTFNLSASGLTKTSADTYVLRKAQTDFRIRISAAVTNPVAGLSCSGYTFKLNKASDVSDEYSDSSGLAVIPSLIPADTYLMTVGCKYGTQGFEETYVLRIE